MHGNLGMTNPSGSSRSASCWKNEIRVANTTVFSILVVCCTAGLLARLGNQPVETVRPSKFTARREFSEVALRTNNHETCETASQQRSHAQDCPPHWRSYVEKFRPGTHRNSTEQLSLPPGINFPNTTSWNSTRIDILNGQPTYCLCDVLVVRIQSRDWNNQPKTYGGDFFRLKIYSENSYSAASEDDVIDFHNGTYLALFTLRWTGQVKVHVQLVHPVELVPLMAMVSAGKFAPDMKYGGRFVSSTGKVSEDVTCSFIELPAPVCNLSNPRTHGPWYCPRPHDARLSCGDWRFHKNPKGSLISLGGKLITPLSKQLLKRSHVVVIRNNHNITVRGRYRSNEDTHGSPSALPFCRMLGIPTGIEASGHFFEGNWYPDNCRLMDYGLLSPMECLQNRKIIILGDSTARQIYSYIGSNYSKYFNNTPLQKDVSGKYGPLEMHNSEFNTSVHFHFHGPPSASANNGLNSRADLIEFVADRLNSGRDGCGVVYIISLWGHFIVPGRDFFVQRMSAIKRAIVNLLDRCPGAEVIIKGSNTRDYGNEWKAVFSSAWCITKLEVALRETFRDERRVGFIDALGITKPQPYRDNLHPDTNIIREFVNTILTYICKH